jgi:hypothetical protein
MRAVGLSVRGHGLFKCVQHAKQAAGITQSLAPHAICVNWRHSLPGIKKLRSDQSSSSLF